MTNKMLSLHFILYCIITISVAVLIALIFTACSPLTKIEHDTKTTYTPQYNVFDSPIATPYQNELREGKDGALIIADGTSALLHRLAFIQMAQKSIDIQTYIYKNELTSKLLIHELLEAASRGVKIRILIDDNGITNDLYDLIQLDNHPNVEVRIFNPYFFRFTILRAFEAPFDFARINKRMHNKLFIFDDTALIMGGRNIGDEYFDNASVNFTDTDLLFIGNITKDSRLNFEEFWNYNRSIPLSFFPSKSKLKKYHKRTLKEQAKAYNINEKQWLEYRADIESFKGKYLNKELKMSFGEGIFLADLPQKVDINNADSKTLILDALSYYLNYAKDSIIISSSYLVPGNASMEFWQDFLNRGVKIQILTNSLASIDVVPVYSHWEHYRDKLAKMGIEVYEYTNLDVNKAKLKDKAKFYNTKKARVSLHSKSMIIDDSIIAVGSFNLDYRSAMLNTESIVFFKSSDLASELKKITQHQMAESYRILYDATLKKCVWQLRIDGDEQTFTKPPNTSFWLRLYKNAAKILPEKLF
ncbi:phospholipase D family protein [Helicobacter saguini]|uniref:Phospholipase D family protein n=2 Tax=Helicobacter saguini TaxID=1548018 RepID=A0A347VIM9_9HELI|nr:phospholipase D family protein [Helicobacter saguini]MWV68916.1 phospholipase D family protein [Helicobacter saguini]MWV71530.1 phospholipase D family protein [Helicobacter saguini]TLD93627.1 phospholipase D family protein [Helicobacter saguini]